MHSNCFQEKKTIFKNLQKWNRQITQILGLEALVEYFIPNNNHKLKSNEEEKDWAVFSDFDPDEDKLCFLCLEPVALCNDRSSDSGKNSNIIENSSNESTVDDVDLTTTCNFFSNEYLNFNPSCSPFHLNPSQENMSLLSYLYSNFKRGQMFAESENPPWNPINNDTNSFMFNSNDLIQPSQINRQTLNESSLELSHGKIGNRRTSSSHSATKDFGSKQTKNLSTDNSEFNDDKSNKNSNVSNMNWNEKEASDLNSNQRLLPGQNLSDEIFHFLIEKLVSEKLHANKKTNKEDDVCKLKVDLNFARHGKCMKYLRRHVLAEILLELSENNSESSYEPQNSDELNEELKVVESNENEMLTVEKFYCKTPTSSINSLKQKRNKRGQYRKYESNQLDKAVDAVLSGRMSAHKAGSHYGVPHSTLEYKCKERTGSFKLAEHRNTADFAEEAKPYVHESYEDFKLSDMFTKNNQLFSSDKNSIYNAFHFGQFIPSLILSNLKKNTNQ